MLGAGVGGRAGPRGSQPLHRVFPGAPGADSAHRLINHLWHQEHTCVPPRGPVILPSGPGLPCSDP